MVPTSNGSSRSMTVAGLSTPGSSSDATPGVPVTLSHTWANHSRSRTDWTPRLDHLPTPWTPAPTAGVQSSACSQRAFGWTSVVFTDFNTGERLSRISFMPAASGETPASLDASATVPRVSAGMNIPDESNPAMPQTPHPLDVVVDELDEFGRELVRLFTRDDQIDDEEHAALKRHGIIYLGTSGYRLREVAADSFKRNGTSQLTVDRFKSAGVGLIDLEAERKARPGANVVIFPTRQNAG